MSDRVRVLRLLEYVGTPEWVDKCIEGRNVKGRRVISGGNFIQEGIIGETPEVLPTNENKMCLTMEELSTLESLILERESPDCLLAAAVAAIVRRLTSQKV